MRIRFRPGALALLAVVPVAACEQGSPTETPDPSFAYIAVADIPIANVVPQIEIVWLCKVDEDATGTSFSFDLSGTNPGDLAPSPTSLDSGLCRRIALGGGAPDDVTITENVPAGFEVSRITVDNLVAADPADITDGSNTVTVSYAGAEGVRDGAVVTFYNRLIPTGGGQGCTPGYWKQPHHFDSWPAPYTPDMLFDAVFDDAFPGMTLVEVAAQGGGGLNALGRHTVAALLNAASAGVSYDLTVNDVITSFNAAFAFGDYNGLKDIFEGFNEQGCPLN